MPTFVYQAKNEKGQIVSGTVEAENEKVATQSLWENKLKVISLKPQVILPLFTFWGKVSISNKSILARQLSTMVSAGINLTSALSICLNQSKNKRLKEVLEIVVKDIEGGESFSTALSKYPDVFDRVFVAIVKAGETAGKLDQALLSLADRLEKEATFKSRTKGALIYPIFVFSVMLIIAFLMGIKVIPQLKGIFEETGVALPWTTRALLFFSDFLVKAWWAILLLAILIWLSVHFYVRTERGTEWWNNFLIRMPVFGELNKTIIMARFSKTLSLLVKTGIPILDALFTMVDVMDNEIYKKSLYKIASEVEKGIPLSTSLAKDKNFPPIVAQMANIGEQSGTLDVVLDRLGIFYENNVEEKTKTISSLIEPVVIVILGIGVGILVFAVLLPIYQIAR